LFLQENFETTTTSTTTEQHHHQHPNKHKVISSVYSGNQLFGFLFCAFVDI
jgi:hypothetical protein